jgi:hypothetical protein
VPLCPAPRRNKFLIPTVSYVAEDKMAPHHSPP